MTLGKGELGDALIRSNLTWTHGRRLVTGAAGAAHSFRDPLESHSNVLAHASSTPAVGAGRACHWGGGILGLLAGVLVNGNVDNSQTAIATVRK